MHVNADIYDMAEGTLATPSPHFFILPSRTKTTNRKSNHWAHLQVYIQPCSVASVEGMLPQFYTPHTFLQQRIVTLIQFMPYCTTSKPYFHATIVESDLNHRTYKTHPYKMLSTQFHSINWKDVLCIDYCSLVP